MDHRPYEDWLLERKDLTTSERRQLNAHLQECHACTALAEVELALKSVKVVAPAAGFTDRFQVHLAARKNALRRRTFWGFLVLALCVLSMSLWLLWPVLVSLALSPVDSLVTWLTPLISVWAAIQAMAQTGVVALKVIPGFIPGFIWAAALFAAGGWSVLWIFSLIKITKVHRGI
jgi:hypothetical protein